MTRETSQVLTGGPALVERALGERTSKEALGGAEVHLRSGVVQNVAEDEPDAWRQIRAFLSYLPANVWEAAPVLDAGDPPGREEEELISIIPRERRRAYKIRRVIELLVDRGSFFEMGPLFGRSLVTGSRGWQDNRWVWSPTIVTTSAAACRPTRRRRSGASSSCAMPSGFRS